MISLRVGLGILAGAALFGAGWFARGDHTRIVDRPVTKIETQTQTQTQVQVVDHVVNHTVTVTKVVHDKATGDATTTTTVTQDQTGTVAKQRETEQHVESVATVQAPSAQNSYSLELDWTPRMDSRVDYPTAAMAGYRVAGPVWVTAGFNWYEHDALVGIRIEL